MMDTRMEHMDTAKIRAGFDRMIAITDDPDKIARMEIFREFYCNPEFRAKMTEFVWSIVQEKGS